MTDLAPIDHIPPTLREQDSLQLGRVYAERKRRERNEHDEKIARLRLERLLNEGEGK